MNPTPSLTGNQPWRRILLALASGAALALAYVYPQLFPLAWIGFVPLLLAIRGVGLRAAYGLGVVAGLALHIGATHWVAEFVATLKGYGPLQSIGLAALLWFYSAQVVGVIALLFAWLGRATPVPAVILFPVVVVTVCIGFPTLFTTRLGETQSHFLPAIQAIEFTGLYGLDFVIAWVNVALFLWIAGEPARWAWLATGVLLLCWFGYGFYALSGWDREIAAWNTVNIGLVQPDAPPSIDIPLPRPGYSRAYPFEMAITAELAAAGADIVVWPETRFKGYLDRNDVRRAFSAEIAGLKTPLLFQDQQHFHRRGREREYNTALLLDAKGELAGTYRKRERIAFGEYIPLVENVPALRSWAQRFFGVVDVSPGAGPSVFRSRHAALVPLICYEVAFPIFVAESFAGNAQGKVLVALSNDGWFGNTREAAMHSDTSILRAVEDRVPLIHAMNNGPSVVAMPNGRVLFRTTFHRAGGYLVAMPYSPASGGSLFSRHPYWFIGSLYGVLAVILASPLRAMRRRRTGIRAVRPPSSGP